MSDFEQVLAKMVTDKIEATLGERIRRIESAIAPTMPPFEGGFRDFTVVCRFLDQAVTVSDLRRWHRIEKAALALVPYLDRITANSEADFDVMQSLLDAFKR
jgi:hypothetical protein